MILTITLAVWVLLLTVACVAQRQVLHEVRRTLARKPWLATPLSAPVQPDNTFKCGCGHHFAYHDRRNGKCKHADHVTRYDPTRDRSAYLGTRRCQCQGYTGTIPPVVSKLDRDDVVVPLADGTQLTFPRGWTDDANTEVVRWNPSR